MKAAKTMVTLFVGLVAGTVVLSAQEPVPEMLHIKFVARCQTTNDAGRLVRETINNERLLKEYAGRNAVTNIRTLELVYHVDGDERGDVISIVDATTGEVLQPVFSLFFPVDLPVGDGSQFTRFAYMFNDQQSTAMGTAVLNERLTTNRRGETRRLIQGQIQLHLAPDETHGLRICTGSLVANRPFETIAIPTNAPSARPDRDSGRNNRRSEPEPEPEPEGPAE
ncbi:MAG TPA: hypothetical protein GYA07_06365 [Verrucomicrobia bacterium]|nr:hypothetical protein [Verrucomicrobiota bacterium]HOP97141.1 hypothetical protein [Verrucomicrobiota bacterium]HPU56370.1 hypothetical protein [Verrucomicrobiota bacterium]